MDTFNKSNAGETVQKPRRDGDEDLPFHRPCTVHLLRKELCAVRGACIPDMDLQDVEERGTGTLWGGHHTRG